jgi:ribose transport system ATP-binding protein
MVLQLRGIQKHFGGAVALKRGDLEIRGSEVHLLLGENGAGKSTLMKIVAGLLNADGGEMYWQGQRTVFRDPAEAQRAGVAMVCQESLLAPHLSVAENIYLGRQPGLWGWVHRRRTLQDAARLIEQHRFPLQADWMVSRLSPAGRQMVEICRAVAFGARLLIFDEPTSSLSAGESAEVFRIVGALRERGSSAIYITHRMNELRALGDRVTVLRDGETVHTGGMADITTDELIRHMVGRPLEAGFQHEAAPPGAEMLRLNKLTRRGVLDNISFSVRAGEIVGLAGMVGAGRTELCRAIFGLDGVDSGEVSIQGRPVRISSPRDAVSLGLALVPEDRQRAGLAAGLSLRDNMSLAGLKRFCRFGWVDRERERGAVAEQCSRLRLQAASQQMQAGSLSGGNQQKVVIGKWIIAGARVFLFDEPTRGIDVAAKLEVLNLMNELARRGAAILMVSSELPELIQAADRILVLRGGKVAAELPRGASQEEIMRYAALEMAS